MANSFLALPRELIETIVHEVSSHACIANRSTALLTHLQLHETSRNSIFDLLRTNKLLHEIALPYTVRRCFLDFSEDGCMSENGRIGDHRWRAVMWWSPLPVSVTISGHR